MKDFFVFKTGSKFHLVLMLGSTTLWRGSQVCRGHCWKYGNMDTVMGRGVIFTETCKNYFYIPQSFLLLDTISIINVLLVHTLALETKVSTTDSIDFLRIF